MYISCVDGSYPGQMSDSEMAEASTLTNIFN